MLRPDVIQAAGELPEIIFPIFTNGTMLDAAYIDMLDKHRNLIPIFSIEGSRENTDERRGSGTYERLMTAMRRMQERHLMYGASVTVTTQNIEEVTSRKFLDKLAGNACKLVFYVEYVPVSEESGDLAIRDTERVFLERRLSELAQRIILKCSSSHFPAMKKASGGCLAAGRGFFHINSHGGRSMSFRPIRYQHQKTFH